jgi:deoxyribonucleoside regulator
VVSGREKVPVARAVVTSGLCTVLVTDEATANALLDLPGTIHPDIPLLPTALRRTAT